MTNETQRIRLSLQRSLGRLLIGCLTLSISACESVPKRQEHFVMVINSIPTDRQALEFHSGMSLAIAEGLTREQVSENRLAITGCYLEPTAKTPWVQRRHGYVLLPPKMAVKDGDIIAISAKEADGREVAFSRYFGHFLGFSQAPSADYFTYEYSWGAKQSRFRCGEIDSQGQMRVEVYGTAKYWDYDLSLAESTRNAQISDEDLKQKRIALGECSPGVDSWVHWKARVPEGVVLQKGDYVEVIAGAYEAPRSHGSLSEIVRKVKKPPETDFIATQGSKTVSCGAHAIPFD